MRIRSAATALIGLVALLATVLVVSPANAANLVLRTHTATAGTYSDGADLGDWTVVWAGYGTVEVGSRSQGFTLSPKAATDPAQTHSALVMSKAAVGPKATFRTSVTTHQQLRLNSAANPWETGWVVFNYTDPEHFYYVALKTNGWELGKRDPAYPGGQRFLATGETHAAQLGVAQRVIVVTNGNKLTVKIDGETVTRFVDQERPYLGGLAGFYTEDATVQFNRVALVSR